MKKIISGKLYDTDTAHRLGYDGYGNRGDFSFWMESLYQKRTGEYFLFGEGGAMTKYAVSLGDAQWGGGEKIIPLSPAKAREWAETHLSADEYEAAFGLPDEDADDAVLYVKVPAQIMAKLKAKATEEGTSVTEIVNTLLKEQL